MGRVVSGTQDHINGALVLFQPLIVSCISCSAQALSQMAIQASCGWPLIEENSSVFFICCLMNFSFEQAL